MTLDELLIEQQRLCVEDLVKINNQIGILLREKALGDKDREDGNKRDQFNIFLSSLGYTEETKDQYHLIRKTTNPCGGKPIPDIWDDEVTLYKKLGTFTK